MYILMGWILLRGWIYPFVDDIWLEKKFYVMKDCSCFLVEFCRFCGSNSCGLCIFVIFSVFYIWGVLYIGVCTLLSCCIVVLGSVGNYLDVYRRWVHVAAQESSRRLVQILYLSNILLTPYFWRTIESVLLTGLPILAWL